MSLPIPGFQRGFAPLAESEAEPLKGVRGNAPAVSIEGAPKGVNWKIVQWTIFQEGELCKGGLPLAVGLELFGGYDYGAILLIFYFYCMI